MDHLRSAFEGFGEQQRLLALYWRKIDIAAAECQSVGIAHDVTGYDFDIEEKVAHHLLYQIELLRIFFSKIGTCGLCEVEEFVDHLQHAVEVPRAKMALEDIALGFGCLDKHFVCVVHRIGCRHEKDIHTGQFANLFISFVAPGILAKVLSR